MDGLGDGLQFYHLSAEPLFDADGQVRADVSFAQLAEFVWFAETGTGYTSAGDSPLLDIHEGRVAREGITFKQTPYALEV